MNVPRRKLDANHVARGVAVWLLSRCPAGVANGLKVRSQVDRVGLDLPLAHAETLGEIDDLASDRRVLVEGGGRRRGPV